MQALDLLWGRIFRGGERAPLLIGTLKLAFYILGIFKDLNAIFEMYLPI